MIYYIILYYTILYYTTLYDSIYYMLYTIYYMLLQIPGSHDLAVRARADARDPLAELEDAYMCVYMYIYIYIERER